MDLMEALGHTGRRHAGQSITPIDRRGLENNNRYPQGQHFNTFPNAKPNSLVLVASKSDSHAHAVDRDPCLTSVECV